MKHPDSQILPDMEDEGSSFKTNRDDLLRALHSFKRGARAAGGPDGFLPQHLLDMCGLALGEPATQLINSLVAFMNLIVFPGKVPKEICETFYGATLIALSKVDGGARPIAIGFTLRRLAGKIMMFANKDFCSAHFTLNQLGVCSPKGAEICVHAVRNFLQDPSSEGKVMVKIDFKNAFNTIKRDVMLNLVKSKLPNMYNFDHQCYAINTNLVFGNEVLKSCEGVQQGDPLGPFLVSLGIQDLVNKMKSDLDVFYLDDGTLGGEVESVIEDLHKIKSAMNSHGLELNPTKCELFIVNSANDQNDMHVKNLFNDVCNGIKIIKREDLSLN